MISQDYLKAIEKEVVSEKIKRKTNYPFSHKNLTSLINKAERSVGKKEFVSEVLEPLSKLFPYLKDNLKVGSVVMKYFQSLNQDKAQTYSKKVNKILDEKLTIAQKNRKIISSYLLSDDSFQEGLFTAYQESLNENKNPSPKEIEEIESFLKIQVFH